MKGYWLQAEEDLIEEFGPNRLPTFKEIEDRAIDLYSSAIDRAHDMMDMER